MTEIPGQAGCNNTRLNKFTMDLVEFHKSLQIGLQHDCTFAMPFGWLVAQLTGKAARTARAPDGPGAPEQAESE